MHYNYQVRRHTIRSAQTNRTRNAVPRRPHGPSGRARVDVCVASQAHTNASKTRRRGCGLCVHGTWLSFHCRIRAHVHGSYIHHCSRRRDGDAVVDPRREWVMCRVGHGDWRCACQSEHVRSSWPGKVHFYDAAVGSSPCWCRCSRCTSSRARVTEQEQPRLR